MHTVTTPDVLNINITLDNDDSETPVPVAFVRDLGDTWSVHVGNAYMAVHNAEQGIVLSRLVELISNQRQSVIFGEDGVERSERPQ